MKEETADLTREYTPRKITDLRNVPLATLKADPGGIATIHREQILDGDSQLPVAWFQSSL